MPQMAIIFFNITVALLSITVGYDSSINDNYL